MQDSPSPPHQQPPPDSLPLPQQQPPPHDSPQQEIVQSAQTHQKHGRHIKEHLGRFLHRKQLFHHTHG